VRQYLKKCPVLSIVDLSRLSYDTYYTNVSIFTF